MPTERFLNLPKEKKERIIKAAIAEFAESGMDKATVAGIVERAKIPRGSFYQYFSDMKDLIQCIVKIIGEKKMEYMGHVLLLSGRISFLEFVRAGFVAGLRFIKENPQLAEVAYSYMTSKSAAVAEIREYSLSQGGIYYRPLIEQDKKQGLIREDVDSALLAGLIVLFTSEVTIKNLYKQHKTTEEIMELVDKFIEILKNGISPQGVGIDV